MDTIHKAEMIFDIFVGSLLAKRDLVQHANIVHTADSAT